MNTQLGSDIIEMYKPYNNTKSSWKTTLVRQQTFCLPNNYQILQFLGEGSYGAVVAAIDHNIGENQQRLVAIKKMTNAFDHKILARRIYRQLKILRHLKHQNIIRLKTIILPRSRAQFEDIYAVFQLMDADLKALINSSEITEDDFKPYLYHILRGLKYLHSANLVHRDMKPRNLLISENGLKICDFGLARVINQKAREIGMTEYVATRWYRAPQLLLREKTYSPAVDIWSVGCILVQILTRKPFMPARSSKQQFQMICEMIEMPKIEEMKHISEDVKVLLSKVLKKKRKICKINETLKGFSQEIIHLLKKMLAFEPQTRITAEQALNHPFFKDLHLEQNESIQQPISPLEFQFQDYQFTTQQLKDLIYEEILLYHFKEFAQEHKNKLKRGQSLIDHIIHNSNSKNIDPIADEDEEEEEDIQEKQQNMQNKNI